MIPDALRSRFQIQKNHVQHLVSWMGEYKNKTGMPNFPSEISENIIKFIIHNRLGDQTCQWTRDTDFQRKQKPPGDLISAREGNVEVKCFTSEGPSSFGPREKFDVVYFLDARQWMEDYFESWRVDLANDCEIWKNILVNNEESFYDQALRGIRPRETWEKIKAQIPPEHITLVYQGNFENIFKNDPMTNFSHLPNKMNNNTTSSGSPKFRMIDLCAGTGGFTLAMQSTDQVECVFANDKTLYAKKIYDANFGHSLKILDIHDLEVTEIPPHDILTAGFPCQPFSIAGKQGGFEDPRSNVLFKIFEILDYHQPQCLILENVKNLLTHDKKRTFLRIQEELAERGYYINHKVINSEKTGLPQHRERVFIVGFRSEKLSHQFDFDFEDVPKQPISNFLEQEVEKKFYYNEKFPKWDILREQVIRNDTFYQYRRGQIRENKGKVCPCLMANMGKGGHNVPILLDENGIRKITPRECFNLQGFPPTYQFPDNMSPTRLYELIGNAISIPVVTILAQKIVLLLRKEMEPSSQLD